MTDFDELVLERVQQANKALSETVTRLHLAALDATGLHDIIDNGDGDWAAVWENVADLGEKARRLTVERDEAREDADRATHLFDQLQASVNDDYARISAKQFRDKAAAIEFRTEIESRLDLCRNPATVDVTTGEFKNADTAGYSRALREVLTLLDGEKTV